VLGDDGQFRLVFQSVAPFHQFILLAVQDTPLGIDSLKFFFDAL